MDNVNIRPPWVKRQTYPEKKYIMIAIIATIVQLYDMTNGPLEFLKPV